MEMKKAVVLAKGYVADLFSEEDIGEIGLEEIEFDEAHGLWNVTIGFRRPWKRDPGKDSMIAVLSQTYRERWYKVVQVADASGKLVAIKDRLLKDAA